MLAGNLIWFTSCTRRSLLEELHSHTHKGLLKIDLQWKGSSKPQSIMGFYFYNKNGEEPIYSEGTVEGFEGYMPAGTYDIVICNPDIVGVNLKDYQGYDADLVEANRDTEDASYIKHVNNIYGTGLKNVLVPSDEIVEKTAEPQNLVKKLTIILRAETKKKVKEMQVNLSGAVVRKHIANLQISEETSKVKSDAKYDEKEDAFKTAISTLGFNGKCQFDVDLTFSDNEKISCQPLDLSPVLVFFPEEEKILKYTLYLPNDEKIWLSIKVHQWESGDNNEIIIE